MNLLIVEDDKTIRFGLKYYLEQEGFNVLEASNVKETLLLLDEDIALALLDINLPDGDGFSLFHKIKEKKDIPIIFLTADDLELSVVRGLDMGADDYITKPFKARELISRINNILRRNKLISNVIQIGNIKIDTLGAKVIKEGIEIFLSSLEYKILLILATNKGKVFSREEILANIWDVEGDYVNDNTLTVYIKRIREKIEDEPANPKIIKTVRGLGYKIDE